MTERTQTETVIPPGDLTSRAGDMTTLAPLVTHAALQAYMWVPYLVLGVILVFLALASFLHYHFQNRGRYEDQKYIAQGMEGFDRNKKYRVTLKSNGRPYSMGKAVALAMGHSPTPDQDRSTHTNLPPITTNGKGSRRPNGVSQYPDDPSTEPARHITDNQYKELQKDGKESPEVRCSYVNEAFDSSGDSEKSLISREMLKKQKRADKNRVKSHMDTQSTDLDLDDVNRETPDVFSNKYEKPRRKLPAQKLSSGNSRSSARQSVLPPTPSRTSIAGHSSEMKRNPASRKRIPSDGERSSRVHPEIESSRDSEQSDLSRVDES